MKGLKDTLAASFSVTLPEFPISHSFASFRYVSKPNGKLAKPEFELKFMYLVHCSKGVAHE
ncbi:MAG: hypothetical protein V4760_13475 [Bdellovibrionota bacterium]